MSSPPVASLSSPLPFAQEREPVNTIDMNWSITALLLHRKEHVPAHRISSPAADDAPEERNRVSQNNSWQKKRWQSSLPLLCAGAPSVASPLLPLQMRGVHRRRRHSPGP